MAEPTALFVQLEAKEGVVIARVTCPAVGERECAIIEREILEALVAGGPSVGVDCSRITMIPSVGLGMLVRVNNAAKAKGGKLGLFGLDANLARLLKISAFDKLFVIAQAQADVLKKIT